MFIHTPELLGATNEIFGGLAWNTVSRIDERGTIIFLKNLFIEAQQVSSLNRVFWGSESFRLLCHYPETYVIAKAGTFEEIVTDWEAAAATLAVQLEKEAHKFTEEDLFAYALKMNAANGKLPSSGSSILFPSSTSISTLPSSVSTQSTTESSADPSQTTVDSYFLPLSKSNEALKIQSSEPILNGSRQDAAVFAVPQPKQPKITSYTSKISPSKKADSPTKAESPTKNTPYTSNYTPYVSIFGQNGSHEDAKTPTYSPTYSYSSTSSPVSQSTQNGSISAKISPEKSSPIPSPTKSSAVLKPSSPVIVASVIKSEEPDQTPLSGYNSSNSGLVSGSTHSSNSIVGSSRRSSIEDLESLVAELEGNGQLEQSRYIPLKELYSYLHIADKLPTLIIDKIIEQYEDTPLHEAWQEKCELMKQSVPHKATLISRINDILGPAFMHYLRTSNSIVDLKEDKSEVVAVHSELEKSGHLDYEEVPAVGKIDDRIADLQNVRESFSGKRRFSQIDDISESELESDAEADPVTITTVTSTPRSTTTTTTTSYTKVFREPLSEEEEEEASVLIKDDISEMFSDEDSDLSFFRESHAGSAHTSPSSLVRSSVVTKTVRSSTGSIGAFEEERAAKRARAESTGF
eukprot:TRINITY_DN11500_c0_g1_i1.p1 TRINITY_DN11500_c0_g1~~TRINITY_DN11500_c0_g1_i1.p1  ORF type:complete len:633 (-),score=267.82 TRINITY_DN11500_c0_g1_i1:83-1981(-)